MVNAKKLEKAVNVGGSCPFTMKYRSNFPITFLCTENPFTDKSTALLEEIIHPDDYMPFCEEINSIVNGKDTGIKVHARLNTRQGYRWFYISAVLDKTVKNETKLEFCGSMFDVTEYLECEGEDAVMRRFKSKIKSPLDSGETPCLSDILGEEYLGRIQQPFTNIEGVYSAIIDCDAKIIRGDKEKTNIQKMSYQRSKSIRVKHRNCASWIIAGEDSEKLRECTTLLDTMVKTVSEAANSYIIIGEEAENSQNANKLLGQNFEDQILLNDIYSKVLRSKDTVSAFRKVIPLVMDYLSLSELIFVSDEAQPVQAYTFGENGDIIPMMSDFVPNEKIYNELDNNNSIVCTSEDELKCRVTENRGCALSRVYQNGKAAGVILFTTKETGRTFSNRERKILRTITQIMATLISRYFVEGKLAASQQRLKRLAYYDVTGIPNRSAFEQDFENAVKSGERGSVLAVEINNLKDISEVNSFDYADRVLQSVAEYIAALPMNTDKCIYRFSTDILYVRISNAEDTAELADTILEKLKEPWFFSENEHRLKAYAGIVIFPDDVGESSECIKALSDTLRFAKDRKLDGAAFYSEGMEDRLDKAIMLRKLIPDAVENDFRGFYFLCTPVVEADTKKLVCCEAHLYWKNENIIAPRAEFLPIIDGMGYSVKTYEYVVSRLCAFCKAMRNIEYPEFRVAFEIPENILSMEYSVTLLRQALRQNDLPPEAISISVSESAGTLCDSPNLRSLANMGVNIIAEDKGDGFFSSALTSNPYVRMVKICMSRLANNPVSADFIRTISEDAHTKGMLVCIRDVDNIKDLNLAKKFNVDLIQGIINGRPLHTEQFMNNDWESDDEEEKAAD